MEMIQRYGTDRVLYGTDYPMWSPQAEMERFLTLPLTDEEKKLILSENAKKVYNIT